MYVNMKSVDTQINEIDKLTAVSNTMLLLVEMSVSERKEVLPYIQTMHPDFKKYYGSSVISTENLIDSVGRVISHTIDLIKRILMKIISILTKIVFFWRKKEPTMSFTIDPINLGGRKPSDDPNSNNGANHTNTSKIDKAQVLLQNLIKHQHEHGVDYHLVLKRTRLGSSMSNSLFRLANNIKDNPFKVDDDHAKLVNTIITNTGSSLSSAKSCGFEITPNNSIKVVNITSTSENKSRMKEISSLNQVNIWAVGHNTFVKTSGKICTDLYGELLSGAKNLRQHVDDLESKFKKVIGDTEHAVVPHGHQFTEEETEHMEKIKLFKKMIHSFRWIQGNYSNLSGLSHDMIQLDNYVTARNQLMHAYNKEAA